MLKETPKSLRLVFAFFAGFSLLSVATMVVRGQFSDLVSWSSLLNLTFGVWFAYIALRFERLLRNPTPIKVVLVANIVLSVISFADSLQKREFRTEALWGFTLVILLLVYLLESVTRLSKEQQITKLLDRLEQKGALSAEERAVFGIDSPTTIERGELGVGRALIYVGVTALLLSLFFFIATR